MNEGRTRLPAGQNWLTGMEAAGKEKERLLSKLRENEESQTLLEAGNAWIKINLEAPVK